MGPHHPLRLPPPLLSSALPRDQSSLQPVGSHSTALHFAARHCAALRCTALRCNALDCTALHCAGLHCTALRCTARRCAALHCALRCTTVTATLLCRTSADRRGLRFLPGQCRPGRHVCPSQLTSTRVVEDLGDSMRIEHHIVRLPTALPARHDACSPAWSAAHPPCVGAGGGAASHWTGRHALCTIDPSADCTAHSFSFSKSQSVPLADIGPTCIKRVGGVCVWI